MTKQSYTIAIQNFKRDKWQTIGNLRRKDYAEYLAVSDTTVFSTRITCNKTRKVIAVYIYGRKQP